MVKEIFNKTEEHFPPTPEGLLAFKNYEEDVEDMIYNLVHGIDTESTKKKIDTEKERRRDEIAEINAQIEDRRLQTLKEIQDEEINHLRRQEAAKVK